MLQPQANECTSFKELNQRLLRVVQGLFALYGTVSVDVRRADGQFKVA